MIFIFKVASATRVLLLLIVKRNQRSFPFSEVVRINKSSSCFIIDESTIQVIADHNNPSVKYSVLIACLLEVGDLRSVAKPRSTVDQPDVWLYDTVPVFSSTNTPFHCSSIHAGGCILNVLQLRQLVSFHLLFTASVAKRYSICFFQLGILSDFPSLTSEYEHMSINTILLI